MRYRGDDMGRHQRNKGARGEREAVDALGDVGIIVERNARNGLSTADLVGDGVSVEVKRRARIPQDAWLQQAIDASAGKTLPMMVMRSDGGKWILCIELARLETLCAELAAHRIRLMNDASALADRVRKPSPGRAMRPFRIGATEAEATE